MGEESTLGFGEGPLILEINGDTDLIKFLDDISQMEGEEVSHRRSKSLRKSLTKG